MRKIFLGIASLGTVASSLVSFAAYSAPIKATVRGYHYEYFAGAAQSIDPVPGSDDADFAYFDHHFDNEIHFEGKTTLDNGVTVGFHVELEGRTFGDQIDEAYITLEGDFGQFIVGDENSAVYLKHFHQPFPTTINQQETETIYINALLPASFALNDTTIDSTLNRVQDNDSGKITYFSPRVAGVQLGLSYTPIAESGGDDNSSRRNGSQWNMSSVNINYESKFNDVAVGVSGGFIHADTSQSGPADGANDLFAYNTGAFVRFGGWDIGGSFAYLSGDRGVIGRGGTDRALKFDGHGYAFGVTYNTGPWRLGAAYQRGKDSGLKGDGERNTYDQYLVGISYTLSPGVNLEATAMLWDADGEKRDEPDIVAENDGEASDFIRTNGVGVVSGIAITF